MFQPSLKLDNTYLRCVYFNHISSWWKLVYQFTEKDYRWNNYVICPHCQSNSVKKDGLYRSYQKYFCKQCKRGFTMTKLVPYFIIHIHHIEDMVLGNVSILLCTLAWMFDKRRDIAWNSCTISKMLQIYQAEQLWKKFLLLLLTLNSETRSRVMNSISRQDSKVDIIISWWDNKIRRKKT